MSENLAILNLAVAGTLSVTSTVSLGGRLNSMNSASFLGLETNSLSVTGATIFNDFLPTSILLPTTSNQLTTKLYVDTADSVLNLKIDNTDASRKTYIDTADTVLNNRITSVDGLRKTYIDEKIAPYSGQVIYKKSINFVGRNLLLYQTPNSNVRTVFYRYDYTPKSMNSTIMVSFFSNYQIRNIVASSGIGANVFPTTLQIGWGAESPYQLAYSTLTSVSSTTPKLGKLQLQCSSDNIRASIQPYIIEVVTFRESGSDILELDRGSWCFNIEEFLN